MSHCDHSTSRRDFLKASVAVPLAVGATGPFRLVQNDAAAPEAATPASGPLPTRKLGKTGLDATILAMGGMMSAINPQYIEMAWSMGMRYFDTADCYINGKSEGFFGDWLQQHPERRKEVVLVTKDHPREGPRQLLTMIDKRLEKLQQDYVDILFIHGLGPGEYGDGALEWPKSDEFKQVADELKKSGKVHFVGFSCHDGRAPELLTAAAAGGFIDVIMVGYNPFLGPTDALARALDACHEAGIGLVAMKAMRAVGDVPKRLPEFDKLGLTTHQAVLHASWSDERIAAVCSMLENAQQMAENADAARKYKEPLSVAHLQLLRDTTMACGPKMCPNCDGRCARAAGVSGVALNDIARYVSYYERDGLLEAKELYRKIALQALEARGGDLSAAREACLCKLNFAEIINKAERYFA